MVAGWAVGRFVGERDNGKLYVHRPSVRLATDQLGMRARAGGRARAASGGELAAVRPPSTRDPSLSLTQRPLKSSQLVWLTRLGATPSTLRTSESRKVWKQVAVCPSGTEADICPLCGRDLVRTYSEPIRSYEIGLAQRGIETLKGAQFNLGGLQLISCTKSGKNI